VRRVLPDEGVSGIDRGFLLTGAVICIDQVESRLTGLVGEREARRQLLVNLDRTVEVIRLEALVRLFVERFRGDLLGVLAVRAAAG
jgi:hypothetical protein